MICYNSLENINIAENTAVTIGKFDGLHKGHQKLIRAAVKKAQNGLKSCVVCFDFDVYDGVKRKHILTGEEFEDELKLLGVDYLICIPFTREFSALSPESFVKSVLIDRMHVKFLFCGEDFRFGKGREGSAETLRYYGEKLGFSVKIYRKSTLNGTEISSTLIRDALESGDMTCFTEASGRPYRISGMVIHGIHLATQFGYPTINIVPPAEKLLPRFGVYYVRVSIEGVLYEGMANLGVKPTITTENLPLLETNLLDTDQDLYDKMTVTDFIRFIRPEKKFASVEELEEQIQKDLKAVRKCARNRKKD